MTQDPRGSFSPLANPLTSPVAPTPSNGLLVGGGVSTLAPTPTFSPVGDTAAPMFKPVKSDHQHDHGIQCACGHDHSGDEGHSHSGVGLDFQLTVLLPLSIACLVLAEGFAWVGGVSYQPVANVLGLVATLIAGGPIIWSAVKGLSEWLDAERVRPDCPPSTVVQS